MVTTRKSCLLITYCMQKGDYRILVLDSVIVRDICGSDIDYLLVTSSGVALKRKNMWHEKGKIIKIKWKTLQLPLASNKLIATFLLNKRM